MTFFISSVQWLSRIFGIVAVLLMVAAVLAVSHLVFVRYVLAASAIWQHEFVAYALIAATFLGAPHVLRIGGHVNVDLLPLLLGHTGRIALSVVANLVGLVFSLVVAIYGYDFWLEALVGGWHGETVWAPPLWIPRLVVPLGMGMMSLQYLAIILSVVTGREQPFGLAEGDRL
jgi:TRAP-type C4-dicarboxylate transport system permease small subunit|tara:strand:- start:1284 stop:1802 length:519 start_codon:yes stop_codon:yes gene_type:complete